MVVGLRGEAAEDGERVVGGAEFRQLAKKVVVEGEAAEDDLRVDLPGMGGGSGSPDEAEHRPRRRHTSSGSHRPYLFTF